MGLSRAQFKGQIFLQHWGLSANAAGTSQFYVSNEITSVGATATIANGMRIAGVNFYLMRVVAVHQVGSAQQQTYSVLKSGSGTVQSAWDAVIAASTTTPTIVEATPQLFLKTDLVGCGIKAAVSDNSSIKPRITWVCMLAEDF